MKKLVSMIRTLFFTAVISLFLLIWWTIYSSGDLGFGSEMPSREDRPSMQQAISLLDKVTQGLPLPDRHDERSKPELRSAIKVYTNPTEETINQLKQNISDQKIWQEIPTKLYRDESNKHEYCHNQYHLYFLEIGGWFPDITTKKLLHVSVGWDDHSRCRESYLKRLNSKSF